MTFTILGWSRSRGCSIIGNNLDLNEQETVKEAQGHAERGRRLYDRVTVHTEMGYPVKTINNRQEGDQ